MRSAIFSSSFIAFHFEARKFTSEVWGQKKSRQSSSSKAQMHVVLCTMMQMRFLTVIQLQLQEVLQAIKPGIKAVAGLEHVLPEVYCCRLAMATAMCK